MEPPKDKAPRALVVSRRSKLPIANTSGKPLGSSASPTYAFSRRDALTQSSTSATDQSPQVTNTGNTIGILADNSNSIAELQSQIPRMDGPSDHLPRKAKPQSNYRRPRPSLSDRTVETLSQIPPSPSPRRRKSSFFTTQSPIPPHSRPTSSLSRSRPNTSAGHYPPPHMDLPTARPSPTKRDLAPTLGNKSPMKTPSHRNVSLFVPRILQTPKPDLDSAANYTPSKIRPKDPNLVSWQGSGSTRENMPLLNAGGIKTLAGRPSKSRPAVSDAFKKPQTKPPGENIENVKVPRSAIKRSQNTRKPPEPQVKSPGFVQSVADRPTPPKSSAALRETIAQAKASRRAVSKTQYQASMQAYQGQDVFPEIEIGGSNEGLLRRRIANARSDGRLNIAAMGLKELPSELLHMYDTSALDTDGSWAETVDLIKLVAADNEIQSLNDVFFPHKVSATHCDGGDDYHGNIFWGLETLDMHGNLLRALPQGLAALERLTSLNVSKNGLDNHSLSVISEIKTLRELRVAGNDIKDGINSDLFSLKNLELLDISNNRITNLAIEITELLALRILLISGNRLSSLPMEAIASMSLRELEVSRNCLKGHLFPSGPYGSSTLKRVDVSYNALTSICETDTVSLPAIETLNISENRIKDLPDLSGWTSLITLTADGNQIAAMPAGITTLPGLKNVDFARNDIRQLDERIGTMANLSMLCIANNPLRERRLLNMNTEDLKCELRGRLDKLDTPDFDQDVEDTTTDLARCGITSASRTWSVDTGGLVDRSSTNLQAVETSDLEPLIEDNDIRNLVLHSNALATMPRAIGLIGDTLVTLDLSHNKLAGEAYLPTALALPKLKNLNLSVNALTSLSPLLRSLSASALIELNICRNRLSTLPILRTTFPALTSVFAADNSITDLPVDSVKGLHVLDVCGNEISFLEPKLGSLGQEGLRTLLVGANRFRVPRRDVVEKGTEAILTWLSGRIPEGEI